MGYGQNLPEKSNDSLGLNLFIDDSILNEDLPNDITEYLKTEEVGFVSNNINLSHLSLAFDGTYYTITRLPEGQIVYKIDNSKPSKTVQIIKEKVRLSNGSTIAFYQLNENELNHTTYEELDSIYSYQVKKQK